MLAYLFACAFSALQFFPKHYFEELCVIKMKVTCFKHICDVVVGFLISLLCHSFSGLMVF